MAAGSHDIETKKPAVITGNWQQTTSIDIKCNMNLGVAYERAQQ